MLITKDIALKVVLHGACKIPPIGKKISDMPSPDLSWVDNAKVFTQKEVKKITGSNLPLYLLSGYGSGYGYGDGSGDGYGYGSGYGDGDGYGDGYGY